LLLRDLDRHHLFLSFNLNLQTNRSTRQPCNQHSSNSSSALALKL
jgi:hypothetical protein